MKITESQLRAIIKQELNNILKEAVDVNDDEQVKKFARTDKGFKKWLAGLNLEVTPMMPGDYNGKGGLVDRYLKIQGKGNN